MPTRAEMLQPEMLAEADEGIDRLTPTLCPADPVVMRQKWYDLTFLHWVVPVEQLRPLIPPELEIDTYEGHAYVGLVPFTMREIRPVWAPSFPPLSNFHETNVRTYVHLRGRDPGAWFFSLDAANAVAVRIARSLWKLPYHYARMTLSRETIVPNDAEVNPAPAPTISYESHRLWPAPLPGDCAVRCTPDGPVSPAEMGSLEHFLAERYLLYAYRNGRLYRGQVYHTPYPLQTATVHSLQENLLAAVGIIRPDTPPLAHYAAGVNVKIFGLKEVEAEGRGRA